MSNVGEIRRLDIKQIFAEANAIITNDHFVYAAGDHGSAYVNKDAIYPHVEKISELCKFIAFDFLNMDIHVVVGPVVGGVVLSQWVACHLSRMLQREIVAVIADKVPVLGVDENKNPYIIEENFVIKRGYDAFVKNANVLVVEDILNSGMSIKKVIKVVRDLGGNVVGVGALCNRGGITTEYLEVSVLKTLLDVELKKYLEADCPLCKAGVPVNTALGKGKAFLEKKKQS